MLPSGNDAAITIAENIGLIMIEPNSNISFNRIDQQGYAAVQKFVEFMNKRALELGMMNT